jgi:nicotinate phosphoribosyltransferase
MGLSALSTDLYELTMVGGYFVRACQAPATFDLFVRQLPPTRNYLVACGIEQALDFLESLHFTAEEIRFLRTVPALASCRLRSSMSTCRVPLHGRRVGCR